MSGPEISPEIGQPVYAGIGARATPPDVLDFMGRMGRALRQWGWWLNSGHAPGADQAWEEAAGTEKTVYLPWANFEAEVRFVGQRFTSPTREAIDLAMKYRRSFAGVSAGVAALLGRNVHIVLGRDLIHPAKFVACWTPGGEEVGGTGHALRVAKAHGVPIRNLGDPEVMARARTWVEQLEASR